jgi:hypothetical protein
VTSLPGWTNTFGAIKVWHVPGFASEGSSNIEVDSTSRNDRIEQVVSTVAGRSYRLSFAQSPRPGASSSTNRFDVFWNGSKIGTIGRSGDGLATPSWQVTTYTVTATGNDRISFRERDRDATGALIDDVKLTAL